VFDLSFENKKFKEEFEEVRVVESLRFKTFRDDSYEWTEL